MVTVGADFLGTWGDAAYYESEWVKTRRPENGTMSKLHAFETVMSLTGTNADTRTMMKPSEQGKVLAALHGIITGTGNASGLGEGVATAVQAAAADLPSSSSEDALRVVHKAIAKVSDDLDRHAFNTVVSALMIAVNDLASLQGGLGSDALQPLAVLLSPYAPHLAEELWATAGGQGSVLDAS